MTFFSKIIAGVKLHKKDFFVLLFFIIVGTTSVLYSLTLPFSVNGDTYVTLLANKAISDVHYPDREMILRNDFRPYLYPVTLEFLNSRFSAHDYTLILLFFLVVVTGFAGYIALRMLGFSRVISTSVSAIALFPRSCIGMELWGVIAPSDVLGRTFALPVLWLLAAWYIKRKQEKRSLWPVFAFLGLSTYIHPVSLVFFGGILFLVFLFQIIVEKNWRRGFKDFGISVAAFCAGASLLLVKIFGTTSRIASHGDGLQVSGADYATAVYARIRWDFPPASTVWIRNVLVVSFIFLFAGAWAYFEIRKQKKKENTMYKEIFRFALPLIFFSIVISIALPALQIWLMREHNWPLIIQQASRVSKYYYLGLFLIFAVALSLITKRYPKKKYLIELITVIGIASSGFGLEWFEFLIGYPNYSESYIPAVFQHKNFPNESLKYPAICKQMKDAGITRNDIVLSDDFPLRYFCEAKLLVTMEEGSAYLMSGKSEMVWWQRTYYEQGGSFDTAEHLVNFAKREKARYALLTSGSFLEKEFDAEKMIVSKGETYSIVKFSSYQP